MKNFILLFCLVVAITMGGCTHVMSEVGLATTDKSISYDDIKKNPETLVGKKVLVGGIIADIRSSGDLTQLEIVQLELLKNGVPDESSKSAGRFLVISDELLDHMIYSNGLLITVIGEIKGQKIQKLKNSDYRYPLLSAKEIKLFRTSDLSTNRQSNPYQSEFGDGRFMLTPPGIYVGEPVGD